MIQKTSLDQLPSNVQIVESNGYPTQAFVFYLLKMFRKANLDNSNLESLQSQITMLTKKHVSVTYDYLVTANGNYSILADASNSPINVTLPYPTSDKTISVAKIDSSSNAVTILPHGTEFIAGETSQVLLYSDEVLDFVSDGINWYLGG